METLVNRKFIIAAVVIVAVIAALIIFLPRGREPVVDETDPAGVSSENPQEDPLSSITEQLEKGSRKPRRAELTREEREENEAEYRRMRERIPGNMFIPGDLAPEEQKERRAFLRDVIVLGNRVRKGTATPEEAKQYYEMKKREASDKVVFMEYVIKRVQERHAETGKEYLDAKTMQESGDVINTFRKDIQKYDDELKKL